MICQANPAPIAIVRRTMLIQSRAQPMRRQGPPTADSRESAQGVRTPQRPGRDYFSWIRFATISSEAKSPTLRVNLISLSPAIFPVYSITRSCPWKLRFSTK